MVYSLGVKIPASARAALERLRETARDLRFEVAEVCRSSRWRLSVHWAGGPSTSAAGGESRLGLVHSEDREALLRLRDELAEAEARRGAPPPGRDR